MKILYDKKKCIKCGLCASIRPDVFALREDGVEIIKNVEGLGENVDAELIEDLKTIEKDCPVEAIKIAE